MFVGAIVVVVDAPMVELIWKNAVEPPPPGFVLVRLPTLGFTTTTLPTEVFAEFVAAIVAAVERSPETAAKEFWKPSSSKLATACCIVRAACWSVV